MLCHNHAQNRKILIVILLIITSLLLTACGGIGATQPKTYTIGVVNQIEALNPVFDGFKAEMAKLAYVEGKNVTYIYHGALKPDPQVVDGEVQSLLKQKVDLFLTMGNQPTLAAKKAVEGTGIPVVFAPSINPLGAGIVESISHPGGNVTGVQSPNAAPKSLEWLLKIVPGTKKVYVFYNPKEQVSVATVKPLPDVASQLGVKLVLDEVSSPEEVMAAIQSLPKEAAILFIPTPSLGTLTQFVVERGIPAGAYNQGTEDLLFSLTADLVQQGKQAARLVGQIFRGTKPADLPVLTGDNFLSINLKTAQAIGLDIPDTILRQADSVIR